jgi:aspartyl-tRNA(Asn)/glutamyl-tRNA(Gln) amidotransferase subunit B
LARNDARAFYLKFSEGGWYVVIGLEVHVQLATASKIFSGSSTHFGAEPNTQASLIDLGFPGTLPVLNKAVVRMAALFGLAIDATIHPCSVFARKNYFYPDLPKGYQISQLDAPIVYNGRLEIEVNGQKKWIEIVRAHLEEDAGKSLHEDYQGMTGVDLNRAGIPLLEIVTAPVLGSAIEAVAYLKALHHLVTYLGISDGNMAEGSMRCDANVSVRKKGDPQLGVRAEIKNINSFRFVEKAIDYEIERQIDLLESGKKVQQETRLYHSDKNETRSMRSKEDANDYRYFPDPDLLPVEISDAWLAEIRAEMPELPSAAKARFMEAYQLSIYDATVLTETRALANYFDEVVKACQQPKLAANWVSTELLGALNRVNLSIEKSPIRAQDLGLLIGRIVDQTISSKTAKTVFELLWESDQSVDAIIESKGLKQVTDTGALEAQVVAVLQENPQQVEQYRASDEVKRKKMIGFFVGQLMKKTAGKANPQQMNAILMKHLGGEG